LKTEYLDPRTSRTEDEFKGKINLVNEMNDVVRKNIVQAVPTGENNFRLKFRPETELGDNEDIKKGSPATSKSTPCQPCQPAQSS